jgi:hypothetical protein
MKNSFLILAILTFLLNSKEAILQDENDYNPKNISYNLYNLREYKSKSLNPEKILKFLFPGNVYKSNLENNFETDKISCWKSNKTPIKNFIDNDDNPFGLYNFPAEKNCTLITNKIEFINKEGNYIFCFFSSNNCELGVRYSCPYIGIAKFKLKNDYYTLESFDPAIDCLGYYNIALSPKEILDFGFGNYGILYIAGFGMGVEDYSPSYSTIIIFSESNGKYFKVLLFESAYCKNAGEPLGTEWNTQIHVLENEVTNNHYDLKLITNGYFDTRYHDDFEYLNIGNEIIKEAKKGKSFNFEISRIYKFDNENYRLFDTKVNIF